MRITGSMMTDSLIRDINKNLERLQRSQRMLATGKRVQIPADDPTGTVTIMRLKSALVENVQYRENAEQAASLLEATDSALADVGNILQKARELCEYGANGTLDASDRLTVADEVEQLIDHVYQVANTTHYGRYIFGGQQTASQPFSYDHDPANLPQYEGDTDPLQYEVGEGVSMDVSLTGDKVFAPVFTALQELHAALKNNDAAGLSGQVLGNIDDALNDVLRSRSEVGAKINRMEISLDRLKDLELNLKQLLSDNEDVDMAKAIMELKSQETAHRLALSVGARVIQPTLIDYLR